MAPLSTKPAYMNGATVAPPSVAALEQSEVTKLQKELLTVADEKSTLQQTVRSFTDRLRQADYSIELISIETPVPKFIGHDKIFLGSVYRKKIKETQSI